MMGREVEVQGLVHLFAKVNLGASLSRFNHFCIGEKKGTNGCLDR